MSWCPPSSDWLWGSPADLHLVLPTFIHPGFDSMPVDVQRFGLLIHPSPDFCFPVIPGIISAGTLTDFILHPQKMFSPHFCAIAAPTEQRKHTWLPLLPTVVFAPFPCFGQFSASALEHFALMKSCHSSGCDGWWGNKFLEAFWHSLASARRGETSLAEQKAEMWLMPLNSDLWPYLNLGKMLISLLQGGTIIY